MGVTRRRVKNLVNLRPLKATRGMGLAMLFIGCMAYVAAFDPIDLPLFGWIALWPWCWWAKRASTWKRAFLAGYGMGVGVLFLGVNWLGILHPSFPIVVSLLEASAFGVFLCGLRVLLRKWPAVLVCPLAFLTLEWARGRLPLDGFPFLTLGYSQASFLTLIQVADLAGVYGVSAMMAAAAGALSDCYDRWDGEGRPKKYLPLGRGPRIGFGAVVFMILGALGYGHWRLSNTDLVDLEGPTFLAVQGNISQALKLNNMGADEIYDAYCSLTEGSLAKLRNDKTAKVVVWPETMFPYALNGNGKPGDVYFESRNRKYGFESAQRTEEIILKRDLGHRVFGPSGAYAVLGIKVLEGKTPKATRQLNSAILFAPDGSRVGDPVVKSVLVPGGEYIPFISVLPEDWQHSFIEFVRDFAGFVPNLTPGEGAGILTLPAGFCSEGPFPLGISICYENVYPHHSRDLVRLDAKCLINISNEAWFRDSAELDQMHAISIFRSIETRRSLLRATNTGVTAMIDPLGKDRVFLDGSRDREFPGVFVSKATHFTGESLYVRFGDWLPMVATLAAALLGLMAAFLTRTVTEGDSL